LEEGEGGREGQEEGGGGGRKREREMRVRISLTFQLKENVGHIFVDSSPLVRLPEVMFFTATNHNVLFDVTLC
jgi:hypothetical protein